VPDAGMEGRDVPAALADGAPIADVSEARGVMGKPTMAQIEEAVVVRLGLCRVPGNAQPAALYRQIAIWFTMRTGRFSASEIGRYYNGRHNTTVLYAVRRADYLMRVDPKVAAMMASVREELGGEPEAIGNRASWEDRLAESIAEKVVERLSRGGTCGRAA
jgi:hypothetical protein